MFPPVLLLAGPLLSAWTPMRGCYARVYRMKLSVVGIHDRGSQENIVTRAASTHALRGSRVSTGTPNVKLIMMIPLSCALTEQRSRRPLVPER